MVLLDTNICLRLANINAPQYPLISEATKALLNQGNELAIVPQNLYELWAVATRLTSSNGLGWSTRRTEEAVELLRSSFILLNDTPDLLAHWLELVARFDVKGKQVHDARLVAAMQTHNIENLLTLNIKDFERYSDVKPVHPEEVRT